MVNRTAGDPWNDVEPRHTGKASGEEEVRRRYRSPSGEVVKLRCDAAGRIHHQTAAELLSLGVKWCAHHGAVLPLSKFSPSGTSASGYCQVCREHDVARVMRLRG